VKIFDLVDIHWWMTLVRAEALKETSAILGQSLCEAPLLSYTYNYKFDEVQTLITQCWESINEIGTTPFLNLVATDAFIKKRESLLNWALYCQNNTHLLGTHGNLARKVGQFLQDLEQVKNHLCRYLDMDLAGDVFPCGHILNVAIEDAWNTHCRGSLEEILELTASSAYANSYSYLPSETANGIRQLEKRRLYDVANVLIVLDPALASTICPVFKEILGGASAINEGSPTQITWVRYQNEMSEDKWIQMHDWILDPPFPILQNTSPANLVAAFKWLSNNLESNSGRIYAEISDNYYAILHAIQGKSPFIDIEMKATSVTLFPSDLTRSQLCYFAYNLVNWNCLLNAFKKADFKLDAKTFKGFFTAYLNCDLPYWSEIPV